MPRKSNTRAAQGSGTIRQRPDGRWEARYTIGRNPGTGKQMQKSIYGDSQQEVAKQLRQIQAAIDNGTYIEPSKMTLGQWLDIWLAEYLGGIKSSTLFSYIDRVKLHIKPNLGAVPLQKLNTHAIQKFYNWLQKEKGLSPKTIKNLHGVLHSALKQAVAIGYLKSNPASSCVLPRVEKKEIKPIAGDDVQIFIDAIKGHKYEAVYLIDFFTGMRQSEIMGLTWDCVDFTKGIILINKQLQQDKNALRMIEAGGIVELTESDLRDICSGKIPAPKPEHKRKPTVIISPVSKEYELEVEMMEEDVFEAKRAAFEHKYGVLQPDGTRNKRYY